MKSIYIDYIGGHVDHCHCLVSMGKDQSIQSVMHLLKGESSHWINQNNLTSNVFSWQEEYFAASVSELEVDKIRDYIKNQDDHHAKKTFQQEIDQFLVNHGFEKSEG